jgi:hypothetical protein
MKREEKIKETIEEKLREPIINAASMTEPVPSGNSKEEITTYVVEKLKHDIEDIKEDDITDMIDEMLFFNEIIIIDEKLSLNGHIRYKLT